MYPSVIRRLTIALSLTVGVGSASADSPEIPAIQASPTADLATATTVPQAETICRVRTDWQQYSVRPGDILGIISLGSRNIPRKREAG